MLDALKSKDRGSAWIVNTGHNHMGLFILKAKETSGFTFNDFTSNLEIGTCTRCGRMCSFKKSGLNLSNFGFDLVGIVSLCHNHGDYLSNCKLCKKEV